MEGINAGERVGKLLSFLSSLEFSGMRKFLAVGAATGALMVSGCSDHALATVHYSGTSAQSSEDGHHRFDHDGDVDLMGSDMTVDGRIGGDLSLIGSDLDVQADIGGNVSLVGSDVDFNGSTGGRTNIAGSDVDWSGDADNDIDIAGSDVDWSGSTSGTLSVAGSDISIDGRIGEALDLSGSDIEISSRSEIGGDLSVAGSDVDIAGTVRGHADIVASRIDLEGDVEGRLLAIAHSRRGWSWSSDGSHQRISIGGRLGEGGAVCARRVEITPGAELNGPLAVFAEEPPVMADSALRGAVTFEEIGDRDCDDLLEPYER